MLLAEEGGSGGAPKSGTASGRHMSHGRTHPPRAVADAVGATGRDVHVLASALPAAQAEGEGTSSTPRTLFGLPVAKNASSRRTAEGKERGLKKLMSAMAAWKRTPAQSSNSMTKEKRTLINEIEIISMLRHPNVVTFMGACIEPPNILVVTEYMENGSLYDLIARKDFSLTWKLRLAFALDAARGIAYIHSSGLLHLDIKSSNLLVDDHMRVKVADFGLATLKSLSADKAAVFCGTLYWMCPEMMIEEPLCSDKADVYSFAIVMYELLTRERPFKDYGADKEHQFMVAVVHGIRPGPIPQGFSTYVELMAECWHSEHVKRPPFTEIVDRLEEMGNEGVDAWEDPLAVLAEGRFEET
eukprot:Opistho-1_new@6154